MELVLTAVVFADVASLLRCPWSDPGGSSGGCEEAALEFVPGASARSGTFRCGACGRRSPIVDGIWDGRGPHRAEHSLAQISNRAAPVARLYERVWRARSLTLLSGRSFPIDEEQRELAEATRPVAGMRIADIGCSEGLYARFLAARGATVFAVDHSPAFLRRARDRSVSLGVVPVLASAQHLPFKEGALDAVVIGGSLNEIGDAHGAVAEMGRVARAGAQLFSMSLLAATTGRGRALQAAAHTAGIDFPTQPATTALFEAAGFTVNDVRVDGVVIRITGTRVSG